MRTAAVATFLFAAGVLATPVLDRRVVVTDEVVVTVVDYVTAGAKPSAHPVPKVSGNHNPHGHYHPYKAQSPPEAAPAPAASPKPYVAPAAPAPKPEAPKAAAPAPKKSSTAVAAVEPTKPAPSPKTTAAPKEAAAPATGSSNLPTTYVPNLDSSSDIYSGLAVEHHNVHRKNASVPNLTWNDTLAGYAKQTAQTCVWGHSLAPGGGGYGQNIAAGVPAGNISAIVSNMWYNGEEPLYPTPYGNNSPDMSNFEKWGHYSQLVWAKTESVGCYTQTCSPPGQDPLKCKPDGTSYLGNSQCGNGINSPVGIPAIFTVCNYYPPGNYAGEYAQVKQPGSMTTVEMCEDGVKGL